MKALALGFVTSLLLAACGKPVDAPGPAPAAATAATKSDDCAGQPPDVVADYQRRLTAFTASPGFALAVTPQQVFDDGAELVLTVTEPDFDDGLGFETYHLSGCAVFPMSAGNFYEKGSGRWTMLLSTGTGSDVPDGHPASLRVLRTKLVPNPDGGLPRAETTVVGEYAIRINNPKR